MTHPRKLDEVESLPPARRRLYAAIVLLLPVLLLVVGETAARLFYQPPAMELFQEQSLNGVVYRSIDPSVTSRYFPTLAIQPGTATDLFRARKSAGTIRIFALGASSTLGYPYMVNGSFPAMLRDRLRLRFPGRTIEVVNLGVTAVTSHTVLDFGRWCLEQEPDALIVYAGHNEYYGALGVGSSQFVGSARWMVRTYLALHESRLFLVLKAAVTGMMSSVGHASENRTGTLMELMARETAIPYGSPTYERGLTTFQSNLEALLEAAADSRVPVVLTTLVSNLKDLPPLRSVDLPEWKEDQRALLTVQLAQVDSLLERGHSVEAERIVSAWGSADTVHAGLAYRRGTIASAQGSWSEARSWYARARDLDGVRFRAPSSFNELLRVLGARQGVVLADVESVMVSRSRNGLIGREYLLEHVHPNLDGYAVIADAIEPSLLRVLMERGHRADVEGPITVAPSVTKIDSLVAAYRIQILVNSWPFTEKGLTLDDLKGSSWEEKLALSYLGKEFTWEVLHVRAAEQYEKVDRLSEAAAEYRALVAATPYNVSPFLRLGVVLQRMGEMEQAREAFEQSLTVEATSTALLKLGELAYEAGRHTEAADYLTEAVRTGQLDPGRIPEIQLAIAVATMRGGDRDRALALAEALVSQYPTFERGRAFRQYLRDEAAGAPRR